MRAVRLEDLEKRLRGQGMQAGEIQIALDEVVEAKALFAPDEARIESLMDSAKDASKLRASLQLTEEVYDTLATYFNEPGASGTILVRRALDEFKSLIE